MIDSSCSNLKDRPCFLFMQDPETPMKMLFKYARVKVFTKETICLVPIEDENVPEPHFTLHCNLPDNETHQLGVRIPLCELWPHQPLKEQLPTVSIDYSPPATNKMGMLVKTRIPVEEPPKFQMPLASDSHRETTSGVGSRGESTEKPSKRRRNKRKSVATQASTSNNTRSDLNAQKGAPEEQEASCTRPKELVSLVGHSEAFYANADKAAGVENVAPREAPKRPPGIAHQRRVDDHRGYVHFDGQAKTPNQGQGRYQSQDNRYLSQELGLHRPSAYFTFDAETARHLNQASRWRVRERVHSRNGKKVHTSERRFLNSRQGGYQICQIKLTEETPQKGAASRAGGSEAATEQKRRNLEEWLEQGLVKEMPQQEELLSRAIKALTATPCEKSRPNVVCGFNDVATALSERRVKLLVLARDFDNQGDGKPDAQADLWLERILKSALQNQCPVILAFRQNRLKNFCAAKTQLPCIGITNMGNFVVFGQKLWERYYEK